MNRNSSRIHFAIEHKGLAIRTFMARHDSIYTITFSCNGEFIK
ncbi:MAG: hypothetical protein WCG93_14595 [Paludibacter sp.]